ncbi:MAG: mannose-6-phosphate isomerase, partial [Betaproteobacteria bacterium]|nr:mannose-6-phosphate isomerase [Betaproteobacteria bacterium]
MSHHHPSDPKHHAHAPSEGHDHSHGPWKHDGVRVVPGNQLDGNVPSTPGMDRKAAINFARVGAEKLWAGTVTIHANAKTG